MKNETLHNRYIAIIAILIMIIIGLFFKYLRVEDNYELANEMLTNWINICN